MSSLSSILSTTPERPVLAQGQISSLSKLVMSMTSADTVTINITHTARAVSNIANNVVRSNDDGDELEISISTKFGQRASASTLTNQLTESALRAMISQCESLAKNQIENNVPTPPSPQEPDSLIQVNLWHDATVRGMEDGRTTIIPQLISGVTKHGVNASGFVGLMARCKAVMTKEGIYAFGEETDTEVTVTARTPDLSGSGWAGQAARNWSLINPEKVADDAAGLALRSRGVQAFEPGRRTAILGPAAVVQLVRYFTRELDAYSTDMGQTGFSKATGWGNRLGERMFDRRLQIRTDPADPDGGCISFFDTGYGNPKMNWVENGVLKNLAYDPGYAMSRGKSYADNPYSFRIDTAPGTTTTTIDEMIANCEQGIYVNRFTDVAMLKMRTGMMTGVTNNGCFLIRNGKIDRPVKNFRILDSPFFFLNNIELIGRSVRAPFGYTPPGIYEPPWRYSWPRSPIIVPPMMVRDFNFASLVDAI